jgi:hypothetical protein
MFERQAMSREYFASVYNRPHGFMRVFSGVAYWRQLGVKTFPLQHSGCASTVLISLPNISSSN